MGRDWFSRIMAADGEISASEKIRMKMPERMNRTIKEATVKRYYYESHEQLKNHLQTFLMAYNFARRLKTLKGLTPYEYICKIWTTEPERFNINPAQHTVGLNS